MIIQIKQIIQEGYSYEDVLQTIEEAVHANHANLNKKLLKDPKTSYLEGKGIEKNRKELADKIKESRRDRDITRKIAASGKKSVDNARISHQSANFFDNFARARSQTGGATPAHTAEAKNFDYNKLNKILDRVPRVISSAKE